LAENRSNLINLLNRNLRYFLLAMILANIAGQMAYSMLSLYLIELGANVEQVGLVFTLASLVPMALQIFGGWLSDTIGRLRAIAIGASISVLGYVFFFFSPTWEWVLVGLCVEYISNSFVGPSFTAYVSEQTSENQRGRVFGLVGSLYNTVTIIGPALGGFLAYRAGFRPMMGTALAFYAAGTLLRIWMATNEHFAPSRPPEKPTLTGLKVQVVAIFALLFAGGLLTWIWVTDAIGDTAFNMIYQLSPLYLSEVGGLNPEQIGLLNAAWGLALICASLASGWVVDRFSERTAVAAGFALEACGLALLMLVSGFGGLMAAMAVFGGGVGMLSPAYNALITRSVPEERRGLAFGLFGTSLGILSLPMPWVGARLWEFVGPAAPFWVTAAACLLCAPIAWFLFVVPKPDPAE